MKHLYIFGLLALCMLATGCGLDKHVKQRAQNSISQRNANVKSLNDRVTKIESKLKDEAYASVKDDWEQKLKAIKGEISSYDSHINKVQTEVKKNDNNLRGVIMQNISAGNQKQHSASAKLNEIEKVIDVVNKLETDREGTVKSAKRSLENVTASKLSNVKSKVEAAIKEFPKKSSVLGGRLGSLDGKVIQSTSMQADLESTDLIKVATVVSNAKDLESSFSKEISELFSLTNQLYFSWTKTLKDMNILDDGNRVKYQHEYMIVKTDPLGNVSKEEKWVDVGGDVFEKYENNLGMAIEQKPRGKFDNEVENVAQPTGYAYVAPAGQSNQYGQWRTDSSGNSFWEFYGQYAFMRDMFWGPSYRTIYVNDYNSYRNSYSNGRTYYGSNNQYGTNGSMTSTKYRNSSYYKSPSVQKYKTFRSSGGSYKSGGFSNSRYSTTGYQRIQSNNSSRSSGYSGGGYSGFRSGGTSGSRSSGGK